LSIAPPCPEIRTMRHALVVLMLLVLPGWLLAQPAREGAGGNETPESKEPQETAVDLHGKVSLSMNTGGHALPISRMVFTADGKRLVTSRDFEVHVWNVHTGAHEQVWRLPSWVGALAASADRVAAAGSATLQADGKTRSAPIWLLPLKADGKTGGAGGNKPAPEPTAEVIRKPGGADIVNQVRALAFSPDGTRLAWGDGNQAHVYDLKAKAVTVGIEPAGPQRRGKVASLLFIKDGTQLLVGLSDVPASAAACQVWDVGPGAKPEKPLFSLESSDGPVVAWSADNKHFALLHTGGLETHGISVCGPKGKLQRKFDHQLLTDAFTQKFWFGGGGLHFLPNGKLIAAVAAEAFTRGREANVAQLDPQTGEVKHIYNGLSQVTWFFRAAVSPDGKLLAVTGDPGYDVSLIDLRNNKEIRRLGPPTLTPHHVGWGDDNQTIAWGFKQPEGEPRVAALDHILNLGTLAADRKDPKTGKKLSGGAWPTLHLGRSPGKWEIETKILTSEKKDDKTGKITTERYAAVVLTRPGEKPIKTSVREWLTAWTVYKVGNQERIVMGLGPKVVLYDVKTDKVLHTLDTAGSSRVVDVAVSPDSKRLLVASGNQALALYSIEGEPRRLLNILVAGEDWVVWTPQEGFYAATPGGEKLIGWQVKHDDSTPLDFYPVERFRRLFYQPELVRHVVAKGGVEGAREEAVRALEAKHETAAARKVTRTRDVKIEDTLPPGVKVEVKEVKDGVQITATATPASKDQPVQWLRLLLDGRPHPDAKPVEVPAGGPAKATWTIAPVPGVHEVKVLARCEDVSGVSAAHVLEAPLPAADKPLLYRICVGIDKYAQKDLELGSAREDAEAVFDALENDCTDKGGKNNRFRAADGVKLLDEKATRAAVLDALKGVRKAKVKPGDLVVVFFGGHGVVQQGEFYLLTHEAKTGDLKNTALSGKDLQDAFADMPCSVLLIMDACHSTAAVAALKPATDDLTRSMSDDQVAVTVLAAAMGYETAGEQGKHGLFTQALLDALKADGSGVAFDPHDHQMYIHHLFGYVFSEVRRVSEGKQNPFLNMPWTVPPLALREVLAK
jgi:WD40 repeat protein